MISITLSNLSNKIDLFNINDIATIVNERKKEEIGYFVPKKYKDEFLSFINEFEKNNKRKILQKVLKASRKDIIGDGTVSDRIKLEL